jgi:hypothetical protein
MNSDEVSLQALDRLHSWKDNGATILFAFIGPPNNFSIEVSVLGVGDESISFSWLRDAIDANGPSRPFVSTRGNFVVWFEGATFSCADDPKRSVTISRGPFRCDLIQIRASAFA